MVINILTSFTDVHILFQADAHHLIIPLRHFSPHIQLQGVAGMETHRVFSPGIDAVLMIIAAYDGAGAMAEHAQAVAIKLGAQPLGLALVHRFVEHLISRYAGEETDSVMDISNSALRTLSGDASICPSVALSPAISKSSWKFAL